MEHVNAIAGQLADKNSYVLQAAIQALQYHYNLSSDNVNAITGWLDCEDWRL